MKKKPLSRKARQIFETEITKPVPSRVLLDQWHVDVYIRPTKKLTKDDRKVLKTLMACYLMEIRGRIIFDLESKIDIVISQ